jgi:hypothetical protein
MVQKATLRLLQYFRILSKNCGVLRYKGREYNINAVTSTGYIIQDAFGREEPIVLIHTDEEISNVELVPEFSGYFSKNHTIVAA